MIRTRRAARPTPSGVGALLAVFARTRGAWWTGAAAALAAAVIMVLHAVTQGLTLSPAQQAEDHFGGFEHALTNVAEYPLGSGPDRGRLHADLVEAGATETGLMMYAIDLGRAEGVDLDELRYEEVDLGATPTGAVRLVDGAVPAVPGQVCVSPALAERIGEGRTFSYFGGALVLTSVCTAVDDIRRDAITVYAAPGTWEAAGQGLSAEALSRWGVAATATIHWSGGDVDAASRAMLESLAGDGATVTASEGDEPLVDAEDMRGRPRSFNAVSNAWVFLIPLFLVPTLTSAVAAWGGARLLVRSVDTLTALGLRRSRTRRLTLLLPLVLALAGTLVGLVIGTMLGGVARTILATAVPRPPGPWVGAPIVVAIVLGMSLLGVMVGSGLALLRLSSRVATDLAWARRTRVPWPSTPLLSGMVALCLLSAALVAGDPTSMTRRAAGVVLVGLALVLLVPLTVGLLSRRGLSAGPSGLVRSRLVTTAGGAWLIMLLFGLQAALTTGTVTLVTSGVETFNSSLVSTVPEGQARVAVQTIEDPELAQAVVRDVRAALGTTEDFAYRSLEAGTDQGDGPVVVVETPRQAADMLGLPGLGEAATAALEDGGALRASATPDGRLAVIDPNAADPSAASARLAVLPVSTVEGVRGSLATGGAVILASTATRVPVPLSPEVDHVFPRLTAEQLADAAELPGRLRFNPDWLDLSKPQDTVPIPDTVTWGAGVVAAVGVVLSLIYGLQAGAAGRGVLAGARAMGLRRAWVRSVLAGQIAWVVLVPALAGVVGSALGVLAVTTLQGVPVDLHLPWGLIGTMALGTLLAFVGAVWLALRGLDARDRLG